MTRSEILKLAAKIELAGAELLGTRVAIIRDETPDYFEKDGQRTKIVMPDTSKKIEAPPRGTVIAVGRDIRNMKDPVDIQIGDRVTFVVWNASEERVDVSGMEDVKMVVVHISDVKWRWRPKEKK